MNQNFDALTAVAAISSSYCSGVYLSISVISRSSYKVNSSHTFLLREKLIQRSFFETNRNVGLVTF